MLKVGFLMSDPGSIVSTFPSYTRVLGSSLHGWIQSSVAINQAVVSAATLIVGPFADLQSVQHFRFFIGRQSPNPRSLYFTRSIN
jgi:hypothetical protein